MQEKSLVIKKIDQKHPDDKSCYEITIFPAPAEDLAPILLFLAKRSYSLDIMCTHGCKEDLLTQKVSLQLTHRVLIENLV